MPYCSKCGVEVDDFIENCPLCNTPIQKFSDGEVPVHHYPVEHSISINHIEIDTNILFQTWMIFSVLLFTPFFVILTISIQLKALTTWAGYPLSSLIAAWICVTFLIFFLKKTLVFSTGIMITIGCLLFAFDIFNGKIEWFFTVGLPLLILFFILSVIVILVSIKTREKGLNIGAFILIASGIFCLGMDILLNLFFYGKYLPTWSLVVISLFFPLAAFFLIFHYKLKKKIKFERFFHI